MVVVSLTQTKNCRGDAGADSTPSATAATRSSVPRIFHAIIATRLAAKLRAFFCSSRRRHTTYWRDWSSDVCSSDLPRRHKVEPPARAEDAGVEAGRGVA